MSCLSFLEIHTELCESHTLYRQDIPINSWEYGFMISCLRKKLSDKQQKVWDSIMEKLKPVTKEYVEKLEKERDTIWRELEEKYPHSWINEKGEIRIVKDWYKKMKIKTYLEWRRSKNETTMDPPRVC